MADLTLDAAACSQSSLVQDNWLGPTHPDRKRRDALAFGHWADIAGGEGVVWLNPPYTPVPVLRGFLERAKRTADAGVDVWTLLPASVGTTWWHDLVIDAGGDAEFLKGRVTFDGPHSVGAPAPWSSALVLYRASVGGV